MINHSASNNSNISVTRFYKSGKVESKESFDKEMVRNGTSYLYYKNKGQIWQSTEKKLRKKGSVCVFPSYVFHRVKPVTKG